MLILILIIVHTPVEIDRGATIQIAPEINDPGLGLSFRGDHSLFVIIGRCQVGFNKSLLKGLDINRAIFEAV